MKNRRLCMVCLLIILIQCLRFIVIGGESFVDIPANSIFQNPNGQEVIVQGQVYKKASQSNFQILYIKNDSYSDSRLLIYIKDPISISIGETIRLKGEIQKFDRARNPGNFDQATYYAKEKLYGMIWGNEVLEVSGKEQILLETLYQLKCSWKEKLTKHLGEEHGAILSAILLGEKAEMDEDVKELYQKSGLGHLLAISGLHISFIGLGVYKLLRKSGVSIFAASCVAFITISLYALMIGISVSVFRAYVMLFLRIGAEITGRVYDMLTALMVAAVLTVLKSPLYFVDASFLMSYGAILGILLVLPAMEKTFSKKGRVLSAFRCSLSINLMLFPILLWFYYEIPTYSILLNLIAIPLMGLILGCGLFGSMFMWCPPIRVGCFFVCNQIFMVYEKLGTLGSRLPLARIVFGRPKLWMVIVYYVVLFLVLFWIGKSKNKKRGMWISCVLCICLMGLRIDNHLKVTMIDVGQGESIYIQGPEGKNYLIDAGSNDVEQVGKYRIEPFLKSQGVGILDYVFVTHGDLDHCNGIREMIERQSVGVKIRYLVVPRLSTKDEVLTELIAKAKEQGIHVLQMKAGTMLTEKELKIQCIQPGPDENFEGNAGSMVLELCFGNFEMLCTGDVEGEGEECLMKTLKGKMFDVLKVSHHGSKNSTPSEFLNQVKPKIALISAGENNPYHHPNAETLNRLTDCGCKIYQTLKSGAITLITDGNSLTISLLAFRL